LKERAVSDLFIRTAADGSLYGIAGGRCFSVAGPAKDGEAGISALGAGSPPKDAFPASAVQQLDIDRVVRIQVRPDTGAAVLCGVRVVDTVAVRPADPKAAAEYVSAVERVAGRAFTRGNARVGWFGACAKPLIVAVAVPALAWAAISDAAKPVGTRNPNTRGSGLVAMARSLGPGTTAAIAAVASAACLLLVAARIRARPTIDVYTRS
jgi:hypothetical protein